MAVTSQKGTVELMLDMTREVLMNAAEMTREFALVCGKRLRERWSESDDGDEEEQEEGEEGGKQAAGDDDADGKLKVSNSEIAQCRKRSASMCEKNSAPTMTKKHQSASDDDDAVFSCQPRYVRIHEPIPERWLLSRRPRTRTTSLNLP